MLQQQQQQKTMSEFKPNYSRKPTGPYGIDSFYIGSEYLQVVVPRKFKVSDTATQMEKLSYSTAVEIEIIDGEEYYARTKDGSSIEYLSPPIPFWAKVTVPSKTELKPYPLFQNIQSPWGTDSVEDYVIFNISAFDFTGDNKLIENAKSVDVSELNSESKDAWLELLNQDIIDPNDLAVFMRTLIFTPTTPPTVRVNLYDAIINSNTVQKQKNENSNASYVYTKKHGFSRNLTDPPPEKQIGETEVCLLNLTADSFPEEVSFVFNGTTYTNPPINVEIELVPGITYDYTMNDSYGDGWQGCEFTLTFLKTGDLFHRDTLSGGSTKTGTVTVPPEFRTQFLRTQLLNADYDLNNVQLGKNSKVPFVFLPWGPDRGLPLPEELASWGIASISYETIYYFNRVRPSINAHVPIRDAISDPELGNSMYPFVLRTGDLDDNFALQSSDSDSDAAPWWNNLLWSMPWNYNSTMSTTGKDSVDLSADYYGLLLKLLKSAKDINGNSIGSILDFNAHGIHALSGGGHILAGADRLNAPGLLASTAWDQTLIMNYGQSGYYGASEDFIFTPQYGITQLRYGKDGFSHPHMEIDPVIDQYTDGENSKSSVGSRLALQQTLRKTPVSIRSKCMHVVWPIGGHSNINDSSNPYNLINGRVNHPEIPSLLPTNSFVYGMRDDDLLKGMLDYKWVLMLSLYYRSLLQNSISLSSIHMLGINVKQGMFSIEGSHDYEDYND